MIAASDLALSGCWTRVNGSQVWADSLVSSKLTTAISSADVGRTLAAVVRANAAIQKLLLDLIACSPDPPSRQPIFDVEARLLENLYNDEASSRPVLSGVASQRTQ